MNNFIVRITVYIVLVISLNSQLSHAQELLTIDKSLNLNEHVEIVTDRDIYITEETVHFNVFNLSAKALKKCNWSKVIYLELITPTGEPIVQNKYAYDSIGCEGIFKIPKDILTGNYYLRVYTKWMRNYSQYNYTYKLLTLLNPGSKELLKNNSGHISADINYKLNQVQNESIKIFLSKKTYSRRDAVNVDFISELNESAKITLSVIRKEALYFNELSFAKKESHPHYTYLPETRGVSISGQIVNNHDSLPIINQMLSLTVFGKRIDNYGTITDKNGRFYYSFRSDSGRKEIFLNLNIQNGDQTPAILVDVDYCPRPVSLPFVPLSNAADDIAFHEELFFNLQLTRHYHDKALNKTKIDTQKSITNNEYFYGQPSQVLVLNEYIALPTLEDYFHELIPDVRVREKNKKKYFQVLGNSTDLEVYAPLVMVDLAAISDVSKILALAPTKIARIEVEDKPYIKGNITYGGIINIISGSNDFAGINFNSSGRFFTYRFLSAHPKDNVTVRTDKNIPNTRNCLLWKHVSVSKLNKIENFIFTTGDIPGDYIIVLRGFTSDGTQLRATSSFTIE